VDGSGGLWTIARPYWETGAIDGVAGLGLAQVSGVIDAERDL
jgi:hypothetical protein